MTRRAAIFGGGLVCAVGLTALIVANVGHGQSPSAAPLPAPLSAAAAPTLSSAARAAVDERIAQLQSQLGIAAAQMPLWSAFAEAMRNNSATTDALFGQRARTVATMTAVENMHSYAEIARAYADNTERLATAFDTLYASLSDRQKRAADALFREQAAAAAKPQ
jgi:periplasmic protein CpxP/Spy